MSQIIYRLSTSNPPDDAEYLTYEEKGKPFNRDNPDEARAATGLSVLVSFSAAQKRIKGRPWSGAGFIAVYELPDAGSWNLEQTLRKKSHYTLWYDGVLLRRCLKEVIPFPEEQEDV